MHSRILYIVYPFILIITVMIALLYGSVEITFEDIMNVLVHKMDNTKEYFNTIIWNIRLPRIVMALLLGAMLSVAGIITQTIFKNPVADPYIIGTAASATFGAVLAYLLKLPQYLYGIIAFIICTIVSFVIFAVANRNFYLHVSRLLMIGISISALLGAFTSFAIYLIGEDSFQIIVWTMGYLGNATWLQNLILVIPLILCLLFFYMKRNHLDVLLAGDEEAYSMGISINKLKKQLLITTSLLVGFSVAFTGMIGFVGLIVPHCLRILVGSSNAKIFPLAILWGSLFLLMCDTLARLVITPVEIPIGVITAFLGAPFFLYLAMKKNIR